MLLSSLWRKNTQSLIYFQCSRTTSSLFNWESVSSVHLNRQTHTTNFIRNKKVDTKVDNYSKTVGDELTLKHREYAEKSSVANSKEKVELEQELNIESARVINKIRWAYAEDVDMGPNTTNPLKNVDSETREQWGGYKKKTQTVVDQPQRERYFYQSNSKSRKREKSNRLERKSDIEHNQQKTNTKHTVNTPRFRLVERDDY